MDDRGLAIGQPPAELGSGPAQGGRRRLTHPDKGHPQRVRADARDGLGQLACLAGRAKAGHDLTGGRGENGREFGQFVAFWHGADRQGDQVRRISGGLGEGGQVVAEEARAGRGQQDNRGGDGQGSANSCLECFTQRSCLIG